MNILATVCLALNIFYEARGEPNIGKYAVAEITMNRVMSKKYPDTMCGVVYQHKQFSWVDNKRVWGKHTIDKVNWRISINIAKKAIKAKKRKVVGYRLYYNSVDLGVRWETPNKPLIIGNHVFY